MYIWQKREWPDFTWEDKELSALLARAYREQGRLRGKMESMGFETRDETTLQTLTQDIVKSSEIEGEQLNSDQVRSSIARRLGMDIGGLTACDRNVDGVVEMMLDATQNYRTPLTRDRLFGWHAALFPTGRSGMRYLMVGHWRLGESDPMQVVSGSGRRERIHFEAPPASRVPTEMEHFLRWFNDPGNMDPLLFAGLAHLWYITIHPFEDGNGRMARAIADMALARGENSPQRSYSMSTQIRRELNEYYEILETTQKSTLDITAWQSWFLKCLNDAFDDAHTRLSVALQKAKFWERFSREPLNERQIKVLHRVMENWQGNLTSSKWAKIAKCSQDTAGRDINDLIKRGALMKDPGGGRSTSYSIIFEQS
ncbi:MAG: Fic family protein [Xanthomonadales bacterium]|jgi:Fic family protein|nr:Fic family protein [Xanthomonadales bacterium]